MDYSGHLPTGFLIEEYEILDVLGEGGFAVTYAATDRNLNRDVVIKEYAPVGLVRRESGGELSVSAAGRREFEYGLQRFLEEAQNVARFAHPNIVQVIRFFRALETGYFVMPYEPGEALADLLERIDEPFDEQETLDVMLPILSALEHVHDQNLLHRDIKPGNILLGESSEPILIDFGAARFELGTHTRAMTQIVTPGYAPIEQYGDQARQGPYTDIYGVGAVMYRLVTGQPPIDSVERLNSVFSDSSDPLVSATMSVTTGCSQSFLQAVDWALAVKPANRPQNVHELRGALIDTSSTAHSSDVGASVESETQSSDGFRESATDDKTAGRAHTHNSGVTDAPRQHEENSDNDRPQYRTKVIALLAITILVLSSFVLITTRDSVDQQEAAGGLESSEGNESEAVSRAGTAPGGRGSSGDESGAVSQDEVENEPSTSRLLTATAEPESPKSSEQPPPESRENETSAGEQIDSNNTISTDDAGGSNLLTLQQVADLSESEQSSLCINLSDNWSKLNCEVKKHCLQIQVDADTDWLDRVGGSAKSAPDALKPFAEIVQFKRLLNRDLLGTPCEQIDNRRSEAQRALEKRYPNQ